MHLLSTRALRRRSVALVNRYAPRHLVAMARLIPSLQALSDFADYVQKQQASVAIPGMKTLPLAFSRF
ncbi:hypothetical protein E4T44_05981 [Aureobasidium sp. EXF-8845]|nr:hypothetical protein E4T44_05981 [Aureobasidium sp. EXF-8845]